MTAKNLDEWVQEQDDLLETFRGQGAAQDRTVHSIPPEQTNWIDEQRALVDACALGDLSHHMTAVRLEGPDVIDFLKHICINDFDDFAVGRAKQIVMCNHNGHVMGDGPLLRLGEDEFYGPGIHASKWLRYNLERGKYDISAEIEPPTPLLPDDETPETFVYQIQGPDAYDVIEKLTDADVRDIGFFAFEEIPIAGRNVIAFGHGMSPESGLELIGPYEFAEEIKEAFVEAGQEYGFRLLGRRAYVAQSTKIGWIPPWPKPVYDTEEMKQYRQWADVETEHEFGKAFWTDEDTLEASFSIEGSFDSEEISDYYLDPVEIGYEKLIDFDHGFIGKDALREKVDEQERTRVSLMWDDEDVQRVNDSIFGDGPNHKFIDGLPLVRKATMPYDKVLKDGELVGVSYTRSFQWDVRGVVSLCSIDLEHSDPGTEVTLVWGEPGGRSPNPRIEEHVPTQIKATVSAAPYSPKQK